MPDLSLSIDLWSWRLADGDVRLLSPDEFARAERFRSHRDRDRYIAGRSRLRRILAGYTGTAPDRLSFRYGAQGRPEIDGLSFNLSHSGDLALLAVSADVVVGADIEEVRPIELSIARAHFAPHEYRTIMGLPAAERTRAFHRCWTRKEAYLKARGTGLTTDLSSFEVSLRPEEPPRLLRCDSGEAHLWDLLDVEAGPGWAGAVAARSQGRAATLNWRLRPP